VRPKLEEKVRGLRFTVYGKDKKRYEVYGSRFTEKIKEKIPHTAYRNTAHLIPQHRVYENAG